MTQSVHELVVLIYKSNCRVPMGGGHEAARVHQSYCWFGRVAACRTCAAPRAHAAHRRANAVCQRQSGRAGTKCGVPSRIAEIGLDRRSQFTNRVSMGYRRSAESATELVTSSPDVILASSTQAVAALQQATETVPIVFAQVADPVSGGVVASLAKPGGNITGFSNVDYGMGAKWVELLKEIAPHVTRVGVIRDPTSTASIGQFAAIQSAARSFGLEVNPLGGQDARDIEQTVAEFARGSNCGLISVASPLLVNNRVLIISLAARHRLPAVYPFRTFAADGGLLPSW